MHWRSWEINDGDWVQQLPTLTGSGDQALPIERLKREIRNAIYEWRPVCISATTGSGKTTFVPSYAVEVLKDVKTVPGRSVLLLQDSVFAARSIAQSLVNFAGWRHQDIHLRTGEDDNRYTGQAVSVVTYGILIQ